ncbi:MAG: Gp138 family membrane-puncturing spike protein [bacterium]
MDPTWPEIIKGAIERSLDGLHTSVPALVLSYLPATQQCVCQPVVAGMPQLEDVPVLWPRGGLGFFHSPVLPGDAVLLVFAERDPGPWRLTGTVQPPALLRRHGLYAFALPGCAPDTRPLTSVATHTGPAMGVDAGPIVHVGPTGVDLGAFPATQAVALAALVDTALGAIVTWLTTHTHSGVTTGPGASGPPAVPPTPPGTVASTVVRCSA